MQTELQRELIERAEKVTGFPLQRSNDVIAIFDPSLNYIYVNDATCRLLSKNSSEILEHNLLQLFPSLTASNSHRRLLSALAGSIIKDAPSDGTFTREGARYTSSYYPLGEKTNIKAVLAITKVVYFP